MQALNVPKPAVGDQVRVKAIFPPGHIRTPYFVRGQRGVVVQRLGTFGNPEWLAYARANVPQVALFRVAFRQSDLWPDYDGAERDDVIIDIYEHWLERAHE